MREILFRAKAIGKYRKGEWVEGYVFNDGYENGRIFVGGLEIQEYKGSACDDWDIVGIDFCEVDPNTICEFTGITDKNGVKIWENDIVKARVRGGIMRNCRVVHKDGQMKVFWEGSKEHQSRKFFDMYYDFTSENQVVGNVFDNPELLEVK